MKAGFANDPWFLRRCPKCGTGTLQHTTTNTWACSGYPNCTYEQAEDPAKEAVR